MIRRLCRAGRYLGLALAVASCVAGPDEFRIVARSITIDGAQTDLPTSFDGGLIGVKATFNGGVAMNLLLDTGASVFVLTPGAVERAGLEVRREAGSKGEVTGTDTHGVRVAARAVAHIEALRCGPLVVRDVDAFVTDLSKFDEASGCHFDGIMPATAFFGMQLTIDLAAPRVDVRPAQPGALRGDDVLELADAGIPTARLAIGNQTVPVIFDTGSLGWLDVPKSMESSLRFAAPPVEIGQSLGLSGAVAQRAGRLTEDLCLADAVLRTPVVELTTAERAAAGIRLLRSFRMTLDLEGRRLRLARTDAAPIEFPPVRGIGAGFLRRGSTWTVAYVLRDGPAEQAGLRAGDRVTSIDGTAVAAIPAGPIDVRLRGKPAIVLVVESDSGAREITVPVRTFVD